MSFNAGNNHSPSNGVHTVGSGSTNDKTCNTDDSMNGQHGTSFAYEPGPALATSRYNRQMLVPSVSLSGQQRILASKVLIIGLGGLGSPAALYLAGSGVGRLGLFDCDVVETSNLHRQIVHRESSVAESMTKVQSAVRGCREVNSDKTSKVVGHEVKLDVSSPERAREVMEIIEAYDLVLDCTDNPATRYLISDLCVLLEKTLISGAAQRLEGQLIVLNYPVRGEGRGPCYRCVFPTPPSPEMVKGCGEIGILGPVVGTVGTLMATEALRLIVKGIEPKKPSMLLYNAWASDFKGTFRSIGLRGRRDDCLACGNQQIVEMKGRTRISRQAILGGALDYVAFCGISGDPQVLSPEHRVPAEEILRPSHLISGSKAPGETQRQDRSEPLVIDTREAHEIEMGPKLKGSVNMPISNILRRDDAVGQVAALLSPKKHDSVLFICPRGNDSQIAAKKLMEWRDEQERLQSTSNNSTLSSLRNIYIGDVKGGFAALDRLSFQTTMDSEERVNNDTRIGTYAI